MTTVPLAEARAHLSQLVDEAMRTHERIEVTRNGSPAVVIVSAEDFEGLLETLDILSDADLVREVRDALAEAARGEVHSTEDVIAAMREAGRRVPDAP
jgi:prevent-host-death family protein